MRKRSAIAVDAIIEKENSIVLIVRGKEPYKDSLALPGGHVEYNERVEDAAIREAEEETGLKIRLKELLGVYSDPNRDPRYHNVGVVFVAEPIGGELKCDTDAADAKWHGVDSINPNDLAFDHGKIFQDYLEYRKNRRTFWSSR